MPLQMLNFEQVDLIPTCLAVARKNADARNLARAHWLLRRKQDGRFLGVIRHCGNALHWRPLTTQAFTHRSEIDAAIHALRSKASHQLSAIPAACISIDLDVSNYQRSTGLPPVSEPPRLSFAGRDRYGRPVWLIANAAQAWSRLRAAALEDGIVLQVVSAFRSVAYQEQIFRRKLARGLSLQQILAVNAAPGFSEHHGGCALDLGCPGEPPAEETFEHTAAFRWLCEHASRFGFVLSYPRDNPHSIVYEPWHWCWRASAKRIEHIARL